MRWVQGVRALPTKLDGVRVPEPTQGEESTSCTLCSGVRRSESNLWEPVLFCHVDPGDGAQVIRPVSNGLSQQATSPVQEVYNHFHFYLDLHINLIK